MKYPKEVQEIINGLQDYKENEDLKSFDSFHLYPQKIVYPNGYYDSRFFILIGFNEDLVQQKNLGTHDGIFVIEKNLPIKMIRIFCDGSTFIRFYNKVRVDNSQCIYFYKV